jgi:hypothetical protein
LTWSWFENSEARRIAERFFSPREVMELSCLPQSVQDEGFFLCWTRKEAYVKARGEGIEYPSQELSRHAHTGEAGVFACYGRLQLDFAFAPSRPSIRRSSGSGRQRLEVAAVELAVSGRTLMVHATSETRGQAEASRLRV